MARTLKIRTDTLTLGMYVAELDRPWLETPFMFQGFRVEHEDELVALRRYCREVVIDVELSAPWAVRGRVARSADLRGRGDRATGVQQGAQLGTQVRRAKELQRRAREVVAGAFEDVAQGRAVDIGAAQAVVDRMIETLADDPDILIWVTRLKDRRDYALEHCINVCALALAFGNHLGFRRRHLKMLGVGALLHDIGMAKVPAAILDKPGRLTAEEFEVVRRHPLEGYRIVRDSGDVPEEVLEIIRSHHERVNGRGYPDGLKGTQISIAVLAVAIADVYDALTSQRAYHPGVHAHECLSLMYHVAPGEFGKELMTEFIRCIGIYPIGSLVEIANGSLGVVVRNNLENRLRPVVVLVRDATGRPYPPHHYLSLAAQADGTRYSVRRIVDPKSYDVDFEAVLAREMPVRVGASRQVTVAEQRRA